MNSEQSCFFMPAGDKSRNGLDSTREPTKFRQSDSHLLRATPLHTVLNAGGKLFSKSAGNEATYELSREVTSIGIFISHNWSVPRSKKFRTLSLHYNLGAGISAAFIAAIVGFVLNMNGIATARDRIGSIDEDIEKGTWMQLLCAPAFLLALFFKHDVAKGWMSGGEQDCFLDKTCIHQTHEKTKIQGIRKLGAFLANSERFLVLYTDLYMQKLWNVYEVACFVGAKSSNCLDVLDVSMNLRFFFLLVALYIAQCLELIFGRTFDFPDIEVFLLRWMCLVVIFFLLGQKGTRALHRTWKALESFDVRSATCKYENDRHMVESNIHTIMVQIGNIKEDAPLDDALSAFNTLVQTDVLVLMKSSLGTAPLTYYHLVLALCLTNLPLSLDILSGVFLHDGPLAVRPWVQLLVYVTMHVSQTPLCVEIFMCYVTRITRPTPSLFDIVWLLLGLVFAVVLLGSIMINSWLLLPKIETSFLHLMLLLLYCFASLASAVVLLALRHGKRNDVMRRSLQFSRSQDLQGSEPKLASETVAATKSIEAMEAGTNDSILGKVKDPNIVDCGTGEIPSVEDLNIVFARSTSANEFENQSEECTSMPRKFSL